MAAERERGWGGADRAPATVRSILALSLALEREAARRYDALAARMASYGNIELSELFASLADEERRHEASVERLRKAVGGGAEIATPLMPPPEALSPEDEAEAGGPYLITPYRALKLAAEAERRAYRYFIDIAGRTEDAAVQRQAEALAAEELDHLARIRKERRRAWHAERRGGSLDRSTREIRTPETLLLRALAIETEAEAELLALANQLPPEAQAAGAALRDATRAETVLINQIAEKLIAFNAPAKGGSGHAGTPAAETPRSVNDALLAALSSAERAGDLYLTIADQTRHEDVLTLAQWLAEQATYRLSRIASALAELNRAPSSSDQ